MASQPASGAKSGTPDVDSSGRSAGLDRLDAHDQLVSDIWHLEERLIAARRQSDGGLGSRLEIERTLSALNVKRTELAALRAKQADNVVVVVGNKNGTP